MKTIENVTLYKCDFCKKEVKRKHAMFNHELKCAGNPLNHRPCLNGCIHLIRKEIEYEIGTDYRGETHYRKVEGFYCNLKNQFLLHPKLEYREDGKCLKHICYHNEEEIEQDWMPKNCEDFSDGFNF